MINPKCTYENLRKQEIRNRVLHMSVDQIVQVIYDLEETEAAYEDLQYENCEQD